MDDLLDTIVPIPDEDEIEEQLQEDLKAEGFVIDNFRNGTVFKTLVKISIKLYVQLLKLARTMLKNSYVSTAEDEWLELKAKDYSKQRKDAIKTTGTLTISRTTAGSVVSIPKGHIFYALDAEGNKLKYINNANASINESATEVTINVTAELAGSKYNVAPGQITSSLIHIEGIDSITNPSGWITREGADKETLESLRNRTLNSWADISTMPIRDKYKNAVESVPGVLIADIDDDHPRGQGTIDIIVTSASGSATETLLQQVEAAAQKIAGAYDNILVKSATAVPKDITIKLIIPATASDEGLVTQTTYIINSYFTTNKASENANELYLSDLNYILRNSLKTVKNAQITSPTADVFLPKGQIVTLGSLTVTVERS